MDQTQSLPVFWRKYGHRPLVFNPKSIINLCFASTLGDTRAPSTSSSPSSGWRWPTPPSTRSSTSRWMPSGIWWKKLLSFYKKLPSPGFVTIWKQFQPPLFATSPASTDPPRLSISLKPFQVKKKLQLFLSTKNSSLLDLGVRPTRSITTGVLRLHLHQGDHVIGHGDHDDVGHGDHDPINQEGGHGAGEAGGEVVQHPRFEPRRDEKPRGEDRSRQPGRSDGRCQHLHREPDQDGRWFEHEQPTTTTMLDNNTQQPGWFERSKKPNPGRTQCRQVMIGDDRCW